MNTKTIDEYTKILYRIYEENALVSLEDNEFKYKDINVMQFPRNSEYNEPKFQPMINFWDTINCNKDLKFFVGQLFMYRPYINNPLEETLLMPDGEVISTYHQNLYDHRYSTFITCCFEKCYNFWDRIGDNIASFFPELLKIHQVDFIRILDRIKQLKIENEHLDWLLNFKDNEYKELNSYRKEFVHYSQFAAKYRYDHAMNLSNFETLGTMWKEKFGFADYFRIQLELSSEGYFRMLKFIEFIRDHSYNQQK
ncbi:Cthe_2314 family HEPN domain-containing protein [Arthrospiribacter ruber]|uniref:Cthe-2314-like HEPN domain-containing protein n=1 Tax=Arthrospiribacter ruber TaxID=2487934 RepID=A0A951IS63_9BACT|nr:Cthe_2314 family HEPN domain-containing protein [Arthrospiribacter ruber]MBW3466880.1 hypothetical protein [Arthrospiribacter ruber]